MFMILYNPLEKNWVCKIGFLESRSRNTFSFLSKDPRAGASAWLHVEEDTFARCRFRSVGTGLSMGIHENCYCLGNLKNLRLSQFDVGGGLGCYRNLGFLQRGLRMRLGELRNLGVRNLTTCRRLQRAFLRAVGISDSCSEVHRFDNPMAGSRACDSLPVAVGIL